jgi:hypothetical protein
VFMQVRNMFPSHERADPAQVTIERIGGPRHPADYDADRAAAGLLKVLSQLRNVVPRAKRFVDDVAARAGVNTFDFDQMMWQAIGGNAKTYYIQGVYDLADDEALVVETGIPENSYFSFQLNNMWFESLDYANRSIYYSSYTTRREPDGSARYVVSAQDPGVPNWLDTSGHRRGSMVWKWNDPASPPRPTARKVKLAEIIQKHTEGETQ